MSTRNLLQITVVCVAFACGSCNAEKDPLEAGKENAGSIIKKLTALTGPRTCEGISMFLMSPEPLGHLCG